MERPGIGFHLVQRLTRHEPVPVSLTVGITPAQVYAVGIRVAGDHGMFEHQYLGAGAARVGSSLPGAADGEAHPEVAIHDHLTVEVGGEPYGLVQAVGISLHGGGEDLDSGHVGIVVNDGDDALVILGGVVHVQDGVVFRHPYAEGLVVLNLIVIGGFDVPDNKVSDGERVGLVIVDVDQVLEVIELCCAGPGVPPGVEGVILVIFVIGDPMVVGSGGPALPHLGVQAFDVELVATPVGGDTLLSGPLDEGDENQGCRKHQDDNRQPQADGRQAAHQVAPRRGGGPVSENVVRRVGRAGAVVVHVHDPVGWDFQGWQRGWQHRDDYHPLLSVEYH